MERSVFTSDEELTRVSWDQDNGLKVNKVPTERVTEVQGTSVVSTDMRRIGRKSFQLVTKQSNNLWLLLRELSKVIICD